jgi:hypothetical protein
MSDVFRVTANGPEHVRIIRSTTPAKRAYRPGRSGGYVGETAFEATLSADADDGSGGDLDRATLPAVRPRPGCCEVVEEQGQLATLAEIALSRCAWGRSDFWRNCAELNAVRTADPAQGLVCGGCLCAEADEAVAARCESVDDGGEGGDGLAAVSSAVVHPDNQP